MISTLSFVATSIRIISMLDRHRPNLPAFNTAMGKEARPAWVYLSCMVRDNNRELYTKNHSTESLGELLKPIKIPGGPRNLQWLEKRKASYKALNIL